MRRVRVVRDYVNEYGVSIAEVDDWPMAKKKKASGVNIPNSQRHTVQVLLRVPPDVAEALDDLAEKWNLTRSGTVARLLEERSE